MRAPRAVDPSTVAANGERERKEGTRLVTKGFYEKEALHADVGVDQATPKHSAGGRRARWQ
ncbi:MAG TPA: hypothetical protein PLH36_17105, partial [Armatimonadota bacterium]|nr:hypothetical protein [Armatimonadota bacterium]